MRILYLFLLLIPDIGRASSGEEPNIAPEFKHDDSTDEDGPMDPYVIVINPVQVNAGILVQPVLQVEQVVRQDHPEDIDVDPIVLDRFKWLFGLSIAALLLVMLGILGHHA